VGARFGLFCYATNSIGGGSADFDWFSTEESFDEDALYQPFTRPLDENMFTVTKLEPAAKSIDMKIGTLYAPRVTATFKDKHTETVSTQVTYQSESPDIVEVSNGQLRGLKQGSSVITASYTDILGNNLETSFTANATYFPFGQNDVTVIKGSGSYTEKNHVFLPGKNGRVGWSYATPIDISEYKYLVVRLKVVPTTNVSIVVCNKTSNVWHISDTFKSIQFVMDLQNIKYTSSMRKNQPVDLTNIASISFSSDGTGSGKIYVDKMFLSNDDQYVPSGIAEVSTNRESKNDVYTLSGQRLLKGVSTSEAVKQLPTGIYVIGNKKVIVK
jgi:hypothetical protein